MSRFEVHLLKSILKHLRPYRGRIVLVVVGTVVSVVSESLGLALFVPLLNKLFAVTSATPTSFFLERISTIITRFPEHQQLVAALIIIGSLAFLKAVSYYSTQYHTDWVRNKFVIDMRGLLHRRLYQFPYGYLTKLKTGDIMFAFNTEANYLGLFLAHYLKILNASITSAIFLVVMLAISWQMTLLAVIFAALIGLSVQFSVRKSRERAKDLTEKEARVSEVAHESWSAMRLARSMGTELQEQNRIRGRLESEFDAMRKKIRFFNLTLPLSEFFGAVGLIVIMGVGASGRIPVTPAEIFGFTLIIVRLLPYVSSLNQIRSQIGVDSHYVERFLELLRRENKPPLPAGTITKEAVADRIEFRNVSFAYTGRQESALQDVSFVVPAGTTVAIVGQSGSGKSTLLDVLLRLYDPTSGTILVDGVDLRTVAPDAWHALFGVVSQDGFLFHATVRENILYAKPEASEQELEDAAKKAYAHDFITKLPKGYETILGDRGVLLSGGQRQRIAIARAIVRDPRILLFDEATSALDAESERFIQQALHQLARDRTVFLVAHRLSTIEHANQIVVLDQGRVAEIGTHATLLHSNGAYARLYRHLTL